MTKDAGQQGQMSRLWQWIKTPPQVYVCYLVGLLLVWMVSFYAGTLNPKRGTGVGAPPISAPPSAPVAPPVSGSKN
jgi:hypothetical protein